MTTNLLFILLIESVNNVQYRSRVLLHISSQTEDDSAWLETFREAFVTKKNENKRAIRLIGQLVANIRCIDCESRLMNY